MNITTSLLATQNFSGSYLEFITIDNNNYLSLEFRGFGGAIVIDWGDGTTETKAVPIQRQPSTTYRFEHYYSATGTYTVRVTSQRNGCFASGNGGRNGYGNKVAFLNASFQQRGGNWFEGFENWKYCDTYPMLDARSFTNLDQTFSYLGSPQEFTTLNIPDWDTGNCTSFVQTFYYNGALKTFPNWNLSSAVSTQSMFYQCTKIDNTTGVTYDCRNVEDASSMFRGCNRMVTVPTMVNFAPSKIDSLFYSCWSLTDWPVLDLSNTTGINFVFSGCTGLTVFPWYNIPPHVTSINGLCHSMNQFTTFPDLDISHCLYASSLFANLTVPFVVPNWDYSNILNCGALFRDSTGLTDSNVPSQSVMNFDFSKCSGGNIFEGTGITKTPAWSFGPGRFNNMFESCDELLTVDPSTNLKGMRYLTAMFKGCGKLTSVPANFFDSPNNTKLEWSEVFRNCVALTDFGAGNFDNGDLTNIISYSRWQFQNCALTAQSVENILVSCNNNPTNMTNLDISGGTTAGYSTWTSTAKSAYNSLISRGTTVLMNP